MAQYTSSPYAPQTSTGYPATHQYPTSSTPYVATATAYDPYSQSAAPTQRTPERNYTLGGDSYVPQSQPQPQHYADESALYPPAQTHNQSHHSMASSYMPSPYSPMPSPHSASSGPATPIPSSQPVRASSMHKPPLDLTATHLQAQSLGPNMPSVSQHQPQGHDEPSYEDSPPVYDDATAQPPGQWGSKN
jgi:hypothetical protein